MTCIFTSPVKTHTFNNLESVTLPSVQGEMEVLAQHAESFVILTPGKIIIKEKNGRIRQLEISTEAVCHIDNDQIIIALSR